VSERKAIACCDPSDGAMFKIGRKIAEDRERRVIGLLFRNDFLGK
jgi:hypothetical protein